MSRWIWLPSLVTIFSAACEVADVIALSAPVLETAPGSEEHDPRFIGRWVLDEPWRVPYEATRYNFTENGLVRVEKTITNGSAAPMVELQVGQVCQSCPGHDDDDACCIEDGPRCQFGARWRSDGPRVLGVDGLCTDDVAREIRLDFDAPVEWDHAPGQSVDVLSVGGEGGWIHASRQWRFLKCPAELVGRFCDDP